MEHLTRLYMASTAIAVIYAVLQKREINKLRNTKDAWDGVREMNGIQNEIVKGATRGVEMVKSWYKDGKITLTMLKEYTDAVNVDDETRTKIKHL